MQRRMNLVGEKFGRLKVLYFAGIKKGSATWRCVCICGKETEVCTASLRRGHTKSCGCLGAQKLRERTIIHGLSRKSPAYQSWNGMKQRCINPKNASYKYYGARGISFCKRWLKFESFLEDMGERPKGLTLERINNNGNYESSNCKWATPKEQTRNTRYNRIITHKGKSLCAVDWAKELKVAYGTFLDRLNKYPQHIAFKMKKSKALDQSL